MRNANINGKTHNVLHKTYILETLICGTQIISPADTFSYELITAHLFKCQEISLYEIIKDLK